MAHHGDTAAFIGSGKTQHATHIVDLFNIFQKIFCNVFRAQRVAGHQNNISKITAFGINVRGSHKKILSVNPKGKGRLKACPKKKTHYSMFLP